MRHRHLNGGLVDASGLRKGPFCRGQLLPQPLVGPLGLEQLPGEAVDVDVVPRPAVHLLLQRLVEGRLQNLDMAIK